MMNIYLNNLNNDKGDEEAEGEEEAQGPVDLNNADQE